jgi:hypothetical protein
MIELSCNALKISGLAEDQLGQSFPVFHSYFQHSNLVHMNRHFLMA